MKNAQFVNADELETLEQYGAALLSSMISLRTLEQFHIAAFTKGLLEEDEEECSKTICWEIRRLLALYKQQVENIMGRTQLDETNVINSLRALMPAVKVPRKRKKIKDNDTKID
jgi:hypothetical protein